MIQVPPHGNSQKEQEEEPIKAWKAISHLRRGCRYHNKEIFIYTFKPVMPSSIRNSITSQTGSPTTFV